MGRWPTPAERFEAAIELPDGPDGCWLWTLALTFGYGTMRENNRPVGAHRWSYEHHVGPIPDGLQIDHLCRVRHCVNPAHLEPVTQAENIRRGNGASAVNARRTECIHGHPFTSENTRVSTTGRRICRECSRIRDRERGYVDGRLVRKTEYQAHLLAIGKA